MRSLRLPAVSLLTCVAPVFEGSKAKLRFAWAVAGGHWTVFSPSVAS